MAAHDEALEHDRPTGAQLAKFPSTDEMIISNGF
jgi:hypothetical protein